MLASTPELSEDNEYQFRVLRLIILTEPRRLAFLRWASKLHIRSSLFFFK